MEITFKKSCFVDEALNDEEKLCKAYYFNKTPVCPYEDRNDDLEKWRKQIFFDTASDVSVVRHLRYLPIPRHAHEFIEMAVVFKGRCINEIDNKRFAMSAGDICLVAPGTFHTLEVFDDATIVLNYLMRSSTFENTFFYLLSGKSILAGFFRRIFLEPEGSNLLLFRTGQDYELMYYLAEIYEESKSAGSDKNPLMNTMLNMFFLALIRGHSQDVVLMEEESEDLHPVHLLSYMQDHYEDVSLAQMAEHFHYSERHMKRMLQKYTGRSFRENILTIRMNEAGRLLRKTRLPVSEVAARVGYGDVSGFRQAFRKFYGKNPGEFRE